MQSTERLRRAVRVALAERGKTHEWLAGQIGIDNTLLSRILSGYRPHSEKFTKGVRRVLGIDVAAHLGSSVTGAAAPVQSRSVIR